MIKKKTKLPSIYELHKLFECDSDEGKLYWKVNINSRARFGDEAGYVSGSSRIVAINKRNYAVHRILYKLYFHEEPNIIDHLDGNGLNNKPFNLENGSQQDNLKNTKLHRQNTSGICGITYHKTNGKWQAQIGVNSKCLYLGTFTTKEEAVAVRKAAEEKYNFKQNHGRVVVQEQVDEERRVECSTKLETSLRKRHLRQEKENDNG